MTAPFHAPRSTTTAAEGHAPGNDGAPLLDVRDLRVVIPSRLGDVQAVRNVSFRIERGERVAILGESGCGKTMTALSLLGLQPSHARISGTIAFDGHELDPSAAQDIERTIRKRTGIVFQDSLSSLNPVARIGTQLMETLLLRGVPRAQADEQAVRMLAHVGMPDPEARMRNFPHELSGGMRQRVMISMALLARPALLVADEPTTALDMTVQAQVVDLIRTVQTETGMALLLITHDLAMAAELCDRAVVMYAGYVVEDLPMRRLLRGPSHPYARALLGAMPRLDTPRDARLQSIDGELPSARESFVACPFLPRCGLAADQCARGVPPVDRMADAHSVRCVRAHLAAAPVSVPAHSAAVS
jgi:oligopeptide/dipeptide ABC transporter ATP-binding protein